MVQKKAKDLAIGQLVQLNSGAKYPLRWARVARQQRTDLGVDTWVVVVKGPEEDLLGAETTISGSEADSGVGWRCLSRLP
jgi:hypothetical protein